MLLLPTSANPLHKGHLRMAHYAEKQAGYECIFAISRQNVDKPPIPDDELIKKKRQFTDIGRECIIFESCTFIGIATSVRQTMHLHPCERLYFVVGIDTIFRINDPKYTFDSETELERIINRLSCMNVRFIICDRLGLTFPDLNGKIRPDLLALCENCDGYFDGGESSTAIRNQHKPHRHKRVRRWTRILGQNQ